MKYLNVDPETNKFVYKSDEPCVLPQKSDSTSGSKTDTTEGTTGTQVGTTGTQVGTTGTQVGTTGTQMGTTGGEEGRIFVLKYYCSIVTGAIIFGFMDKLPFAIYTKKSV
jgi:hypothetical protein